MKRKQGNPAVGRDVDIGSRPVETVETADVNITTQVDIPRRQAAWVALPFSMAVLSTLLAPVLMGQKIFWGAAGITALAAFLWSVQYEMLWLDRVTLPLLVGFVALCFSMFADWQGWQISHRWQPIPALLSVVSLTFWWVFTGAAWLTFWQRLGLPMYHQQYSVWKALGNLLEHWGKKERAQAQDVDRDELPIKFEMVSENGRIRHNVETPFARGVMVWVARILSEETFSEASLCGPDKPLPGGQGGREDLERLRAWMIEYGFLRWNRTNGKGEPIPTQGMTLTRNGVRWIEEVGR